MLISVHFPKSGGSSFGAVLARHFGDRLLLDYGDFPINTPTGLRRRKAAADAAANEVRDFGAINCIHGHFLPAKYLPLKRRGAEFVTWLREPLERMASHYEFWRSTFDPASAPRLHRRVIEEDWSFEQFSLSPELRNIYRQFLWSFPLSLFSFVGLTEHFASDVTAFARRFLGVTLQEVPHLNRGQGGAPDLCRDEGFRRTFEEFHAADYHLYRHQLSLRNASPSAPRVAACSGR
jgi:hypothetical protein